MYTYNSGCFTLHSIFFQVKIIAKNTLNEKEGPLALMTKTLPCLAQNYSVIATIFHSVATLVCRHKSHILLPFTAMLYHPSSLVVSFMYISPFNH